MEKRKLKKRLKSIFSKPDKYYDELEKQYPGDWEYKR